jgi:hypothetical protein
VSPSSRTDLAAGPIANHDEITVILIERTDGTPPLVRVHWPLRPPQQPPPRTTLLWRPRSYALSLRARRLWHDIRREDYEQRSESVPAIRERSPRSRGVRVVGVVGAQLRCPNCAASPS